MMTPQQRRNWVVGALAIIILLVGLLLILLLLRRPERAPVAPEVQQSLPAQEIRETAPSAVVPVTPAVASAKTVAGTFVERFGTYSSDVAFINVEEVQTLSTPEYYATLAAMVTPVPEGTEYRGRTTRVLSVEQTGGSEAEGRITFLVSVQHEVAAGNRANAIIDYQAANVTVEKRREAWLVSAFAWE